VQVAPQDSTGGLSGALAQAGALVSLNALVGNREPIEADLAIARSHVVLRDAAIELGAARRKPGEGPLNPSALAKAELKIRHKVDVAAVRGNLLQIEVKDSNPRSAMDVAAAYENAIRKRVATLSLEQTAQRERVAIDRYQAAQNALAGAQTAITDFQVKNKFASPEAQLGVGVNLLAGLQGQYDAKEVQLRSLQQFATANNLQVRSLQSDLESLKTQIERARDAATGHSGGPTLEGITIKNPQYFELVRNLNFEETLVGIYEKYLEETRIDIMSSDATVLEIEPPYVDPGRQYNGLPSGALGVLTIIFLLIEFYAWRPPSGFKNDE
jgi:capsule polysaccharide export protein KpsE/RkpR